MALASNHRHYTNTTSNMSSCTNCSPHFLPLSSSKSLTANRMSSAKTTWLDYCTDTSTKTVKDELFDCDFSDISSLQTHDIDYTIIDTDMDSLYTNNSHSHEVSTLEKSENKNKNKKPKIIKCKSTINLIN